MKSVLSGEELGVIISWCRRPEPPCRRNTWVSELPWRSYLWPSRVVTPLTLTEPPQPWREEPSSTIAATTHTQTITATGWVGSVEPLAVLDGKIAGKADDENIFATLLESSVTGSSLTQICSVCPVQPRHRLNKYNIWQKLTDRQANLSSYTFIISEAEAVSNSLSTKVTCKSWYSPPSSV